MKLKARIIQNFPYFHISVSGDLSVGLSCSWSTACYIVVENYLCPQIMGSLAVAGRFHPLSAGIYRNCSVELR